MEMVNGSRFGVALMGLGIARRCVAEATAWAHHRQAKGRALVDLPLVREQLVDLLAELEAATALGFECTAASKASDGARLRRILVPAAKVRLCRFGVEAASYAVELHGGNGYCEDWGLTRQLRDAQCHPIWEGSENICVLDVLRAIRRDGSHEALLDRIDAALAARRRAGLGAEGVEAVPAPRRWPPASTAWPGSTRRPKLSRPAVRSTQPHDVGGAAARAGGRRGRAGGAQGPGGAAVRAPPAGARQRLGRRHRRCGGPRAAGLRRARRDRGQGGG